MKNLVLSTHALNLLAKISIWSNQAPETILEQLIETEAKDPKYSEQPAEESSCSDVLGRKNKC